MACFLVPGTEAIVTTIVTAVVKKKENDIKRKVEEGTISVSETKGHDFSRKLGWLNKMLWGGSALLAFEHVWHGEISPVFPFLTAVKEGETLGMLQEMGTAGVGMAVLVTLAWVGMVIVTNALEKKGAESVEKDSAKANN